MTDPYQSTDLIGVQRRSDPNDYRATDLQGVESKQIETATGLGKRVGYAGQNFLGDIDAVQGLGQKLAGYDEAAAANFESAQAHQQRAREIGPDIQTLDDAKAAGGGVGAYLEYGATELVNMLPGMVGGVGVGALGGKVARGAARRQAVGAVEASLAARAAPGARQTAAVKQALTEAPEAATAAVAARQRIEASAGYAAKLAQRTPRVGRNLELATRAGRIGGATIGQYPSMVGGSVDVLADENTDQTGAAKVAFGDLVASAVGSVPVDRFLGRLGQVGTRAAGDQTFTAAVKRFLPRVKKGMVEQGLSEGSTEALQSAVQLAGHQWVDNNFDLLSADAVDNYVASFLVGGALGGAMGAGAEVSVGTGDVLRGAANSLTPSPEMRAKAKARLEQYNGQLAAAWDKRQSFRAGVVGMGSRAGQVITDTANKTADKLNERGEGSVAEKGASAVDRFRKILSDASDGASAAASKAKEAFNGIRFNRDADADVDEAFESFRRSLDGPQNDAAARGMQQPFADLRRPNPIEFTAADDPEAKYINYLMSQINPQSSVWANPARALTVGQSLLKPFRGKDMSDQDVTRIINLMEDPTSGLTKEKFGKWVTQGSLLREAMAAKNAAEAEVVFDENEGLAALETEGGSEADEAAGFETGVRVAPDGTDRAVVPPRAIDAYTAAARTGQTAEAEAARIQARQELFSSSNGGRRIIDEGASPKWFAAEMDDKNKRRPGRLGLLPVEGQPAQALDLGALASAIRAQDPNLTMQEALEDGLNQLILTQAPDGVNDGLPQIDPASIRPGKFDIGKGVDKQTVRITPAMAAAIRGKAPDLWAPPKNDRERWKAAERIAYGRAKAAGYDGLDEQWDAIMTQRGADRLTPEAREALGRTVNDELLAPALKSIERKEAIYAQLKAKRGAKPLSAKAKAALPLRRKRAVDDRSLQSYEEKDEYLYGADEDGKALRPENDADLFDPKRGIVGTAMSPGPGAYSPNNSGMTEVILNGAVSTKAQKIMGEVRLREALTTLAEKLNQAQKEDQAKKPGRKPKKPPPDITIEDIVSVNEIAADRRELEAKSKGTVDMDAPIRVVVEMANGEFESGPGITAPIWLTRLRTTPETEKKPKPGAMTGYDRARGKFGQNQRKEDAKGVKRVDKDTPLRDLPKDGRFDYGVELGLADIDARFPEPVAEKGADGKDLPLPKWAIAKIADREARIAKLKDPASGQALRLFEEALAGQRDGGRVIESKWDAEKADGEPDRNYKVLDGGKLRETAESSVGRGEPKTAREVLSPAERQAAKKAVEEAKAAKKAAREAEAATPRGRAREREQQRKNERRAERAAADKAEDARLQAEYSAAIQAASRAAAQKGNKRALTRAIDQALNTPRLRATLKKLAVRGITPQPQVAPVFYKPVDAEQPRLPQRVPAGTKFPKTKKSNKNPVDNLYAKKAAPVSAAPAPVESVPAKVVLPTQSASEPAFPDPAPIAAAKPSFATSDWGRKLAILVKNGKRTQADFDAAAAQYAGIRQNRDTVGEAKAGKHDNAAEGRFVRGLLDAMGLESKGVKVRSASKVPELVNVSSAAILPDGTLYMGDALKGKERIEVLVHEVGHRVFDAEIARLTGDSVELIAGLSTTAKMERLAKADPQLHDALAADFYAWRDKYRKPDSKVMAVNSSRAPQARGENMAARRTKAGAANQTVGDLSKEDREYLFSFEEWLADNIARALTTKKAKNKPSRVEAFFDKLGSALRDVYDAVFGPASGGKKYAAAPSVEAWVQSLFDRNTQAVRAAGMNVPASKAKLIITAAMVSRVKGLKKDAVVSRADVEAVMEFVRLRMNDKTRLILEKAVGLQRITQTLHNIYKDQEDLRQLLSSGEQGLEGRIALAFIAHQRGQVKFGPDTTDAFGRFRQWLADLLPWVGLTEFANRVFDDMADGTIERARQQDKDYDIKARAGVNNALQRTVNSVEAALDKVGEPISKVFSGKARRALESGIPGWRLLSSVLQRAGGDTGPDRGMIAARRDAISKFTGRAVHAFDVINAVPKYAANPELAARMRLRTLTLLQRGPLGAKEIDAKGDNGKFLHPTSVRTAYKSLRGLFDEMHDYMVDAGLTTPDSKRADFFPVMLDIHNEAAVGRLTKLLSQKHMVAQIRQLPMFQEDGKPSKRKPEDLVQNLVDGAMRNSDGLAQPNGVPEFKALNARLMQFVYDAGTEADIKEFARLQLKDPSELFARYIQPMVKAAEFERSFRRYTLTADVVAMRAGEAFDAKNPEPDTRRMSAKEEAAVLDAHDGNRKAAIEEAVSAHKQRFGDGPNAALLLERMKAEGATDAQIDEADNQVKAALGLYGAEGSPVLALLSPNLARRMAGNNTLTTMQGIQAYQNMRLLPLAVLSSLVDPMGIAVRTGGDFGTAWTGFKTGLHAIFSKAKREEIHQMLAHLGSVDDMMTMESLHERFGGGGNKFSKGVNEFVFKWNGLAAYTRITRYMALESAHAFILKHATQAITNGDPKSIRYLDELNLKVSDLDSVTGPDGKDRVRLLDAAELLAATPEEKASDARVRSAIMQFVDESILRPNSQQTPLWHSDPYMALVTQYKAFAYAIHDQIGGRIGRELQHGNSSVLLGALSYLPIIVGAELLREWLQYGSEGNPRRAEWGTMEYTKLAIEKSGVVTPGYAALVDSVNDVNSGRIAGSSQVGPTGSQVRDVFTQRAASTIEESLPANALYRNRINPLTASPDVEAPDYAPRGT